MQRLPLIVGFGGVNSAGRASFHHAYRRMVADALDEGRASAMYQSLATLMRLDANSADAEARQHIRNHTLIRQIERPELRQLNARQRVSLSDAQFTVSTRQLPEPLPEGWRVVREADGVSFIHAGTMDIQLPDTKTARVTSAGQLPSGFDPAALYQSRNHPRGLQLTVFAASDALRSTGIDLEHIKRALAPDQIGVYSGSAMGQLDAEGYGGLLQNLLLGRRPTAKNVPLGLPEMPGDFINAYVLGSTGETAGIIGACATFLYNLKFAMDAIRTGNVRMAVVGNAEAPIVPEVIEGYRTMGALAEDESLMALDDSSITDHRRACRPFSSNSGFTVAESAIYAVLMDDELAMQLGARNLGGIGDVFINADGFKKSIPGPGVGNYLTFGKAMAATRAILGDEGLRHRTHVQAHGTGTPQNRVTESHILDQLAGIFGISALPVAAIKSYVGHSMAPASADQLAAVLGVWEDGIVPGILTVDHIADDVHQRHLRFPLQHLELDPAECDAALINSKGFGGNNATGLVVAPRVCDDLIAARWGRSALNDYRRKRESTDERARDYDERMKRETLPSIYHFGEGVLDAEGLTIDPEHIGVSGYGIPIDLNVPNPYTD